MKVKLKEIVDEFIIPARDKPKNFDGDIPWCRIEDLNGKYLSDTTSNNYVSEETVEKMNLKLIPKGSIIFSCSASIGKVSILKKDLCTNQTFIGLVPNEKVDVDYLYYQLGLYKNSLEKLASVTTIPYISKNTFKNFEIIFHEKVKQKKISGFLSLLDEKIEANIRLINKLEELSKLLYDYWFVQFDFPTKKGLYKKTGGKLKYSNAIDREIPENWKVELVSDVGKVVDCLHSKKPKSVSEGNMYLLQLENIREDGLIDITNKYKVGKDDYLKWTRRIELSEGDIVITNAGRVASVGRVPSYVKSGIGRNITAIRPHKLPSTYFYLAFNGEDIRRQILSNTDTGSFFKSLNVKGIKKLYMVVPDRNLLNKFEDIVSPIQRKRESLYNEVQNLRNLRDWITPMLMNGQVSIKETEDKLGKTAVPITEYLATKKPTNVDFYRRTVLAAEIVWQLHHQPTLGHVKLQKIIYLAQQSSNMMLPTNFVKQAAGPYDPQMARSLDKQFKQKKWFKFQKDEFLKYKPLEKAGEHTADFDKYFHEEKENIQFFIDTFKKAKTDKVEIIATLYACWKELIEEGKSVTDDVLIEQFYNWSEEKARFKQERLEKAINWMKDEGVYPVT